MRAKKCTITQLVSNGVEQRWEDEGERVKDREIERMETERERGKKDEDD